MAGKRHNWSDKGGQRHCQACYLVERDENGVKVWTWRKRTWNSDQDSVPKCPPRGA